MSKAIGLATHAKQLSRRVLKLDELSYIRTTSLRTFEKCPYTWATKYLTPVVTEEPRTGSAAVGTAAHTILHDHGRQIVEAQAFATVDSKWPMADEVSRAWQVVPAAEHQNLLDYMQVINDLAFAQQWKLIAVESEFIEPMVGGMPKVRGQRDMKWWRPDDATLMVMDHKTNRNFDTLSHWKSDIQPQVYSWSARREHGPTVKVRFMIGYVNLGSQVEWETTAEDDADLQVRVGGIWEDMKAYEASGDWPMTIGGECGWCPLKSSCPELSQSLATLKDSFLSKVGQRTLGEQREWLKAVVKAASAMLAEVEGSLEAKLLAANQPVRQGNYLYSLEYKESRKASFMSVYSAIAAKLPYLEQAQRDAVIAAIDDAFTVKVTGVDKLVRLAKPLGEAVNPLMPKVKSDSPSIEAKPIGTEAKAIGK